MTHGSYDRRRLAWWPVTVVGVFGAAIGLSASGVSGGEAAAQPPRDGPVICGSPVAVAKEPPPGSAPVLLAFGLCFDRQGGIPLVDPQTYLSYVKLRPSEPSRDSWVPYDDAVEALALADFKRLWETQFLDDLSIDVAEYRFANGVIGKLVTYHLEERQRVKFVDYDGATRVTRSAIEDRLREKALQVRADAFLDSGLLRRIAASVRDLYADKGYPYAEVKPVIAPVVDAMKSVTVTFRISEGPRVVIRDVQFLGNKAFDDDQLGAVMKSNRAQGLLRSRASYQTGKFDEDADLVTAFYRDHGYIEAKVGQPDLRVLDDDADGTTRWVQLRVPVTEGRQFTVGAVAFDGAATVKPEALRGLFPLHPGDVYSEAAVRKGLDRAREAFGQGGYYEFSGYPDLTPHEDSPTPAGGRPARGVVDVTMRLQEGKRFFVQRINFTGNVTTRDPVIRRELMLVEAGVFNTEALKQSVRRLNQLGYFKPLEGEAIAVEKVAGTDDRVSVTLKLEEQNRNQVSFGAGASQYDGIFANASYSTSNFLGRGETATLSLQKGSRSNNYQVAFSEPFLFGRPITGGLNLYSRKLDYRLTSNTVDYSEVRTGVSTTAGLPVRRFTRGFLTYGYEVVETATSLIDGAASTSASGALFGLRGTGRYVQSSVTPSLVFNTVDNPVAPRSGNRLTLTYQYAGGILGGNTDFIRPELEGVVYIPVTRRTALGLRANTGAIWNYGKTELPYYLRYFMGGETQVRGVDIRTVGPVDENGLALGGTRFVLFNAEYYYDIAPRVRAMLFHDAGQAFDESTQVNLRTLRTSSGVELRVTLPIIGAPVRLIYAWNIYRDTYQPARAFKFAVGTTF